MHDPGLAPGLGWREVEVGIARKDITEEADGIRLWAVNYTEVLQQCYTSEF